MRRAPRNTIHLEESFFLHAEKEAKSVVPLRRRSLHTRNSAKPTQGVWGHAPRNRIHREYFCLVQKKEQKEIRSIELELLSFFIERNKELFHFMKSHTSTIIPRSGPGVWKLNQPAALS
jgi:hypothetical protein